MRSSFYAILILALFANLAPFYKAVELSDPKQSSLNFEAAVKTITAAEFKEHITSLASDKMRGRDTPSAEIDETAKYISMEFKKYGLISPEGIDNYIQWWYYSGEKVPNCIGYLEGSDAKLKLEYVVVGAHMDHVGIDKDGSICNGADDNASGTTAVLELAEAMGSLKVKPKRSVVFIAFAGEEKNLLGSKYYVENPVFPLKQTVAMVNFDMIGRSENDYLFIGGTGTSDKWEEIISGLTKRSEYKFKNLETAKGGKAPSDNTNFYDKWIPVLFLFTNIHDDYHRAGDDVDKINSAGSEKIARLGFEIVFEVANLTNRIAFKSFPDNGLPKDFFKRMKKWAAGEKINPKDN